jgi:SNF2 family DNA or RNA helicase
LNFQSNIERTNEIENHFEKHAFKYHTYHDANRKKYSYSLQDNDIVFTTYEIATRELDFDENSCMSKNDSPLAKIKWKRVILDEAHRIKNHTTKSSKNISAITSKYRLAITGANLFFNFFSASNLDHVGYLGA